MQQKALFSKLGIALLKAKLGIGPLKALEPFSWLIIVAASYIEVQTMKVATWNVNGLQARLAFVLHWLRARQPDIVCLQELKLSGDKFPHLLFEGEGYHAIVHGQKAWNGVAILSREKGETLIRGLPGGQDLGARLVTARVGDLSVSSVYCPNGKSVDHEDYPRKLRWFGCLAEYLEGHTLANEPYILGGDFNLCPTSLDSWNETGLAGRIFHTSAEREAFSRLTGWGLTDLYRQLWPEEKQFTWWDYRAGAFHRNQGLRIDFLLATSPLSQRLKRVEVDREYRKKKDGLIASDHAPVIATFG